MTKNELCMIIHNAKELWRESYKIDYWKNLNCTQRRFSCSFGEIARVFWAIAKELNECWQVLNNLRQFAAIQEKR